jgi:hypothetical protein
MRIILEPTQNQRNAVNSNHRVVLEHKSDDLNVEEAVCLVRDALIAWGYSPANVYEQMGKKI